VEKSSGRISLLIRWELISGGRTERRWWSGDPFIEEENRRLESSCRLAKSHGSLDLGEGARRLILRRGEDCSRFVSADRGWRVQ
jgi:hypothetical protein